MGSMVKLHPKQPHKRISLRSLRPMHLFVPKALNVTQELAMEIKTVSLCHYHAAQHTCS